MWGRLEVSNIGLAADDKDKERKTRRLIIIITIIIIGTSVINPDIRKVTHILVVSPD